MRQLFRLRRLIIQAQIQPAFAEDERSFQTEQFFAAKVFSKMRSEIDLFEVGPICLADGPCPSIAVGQRSAIGNDMLTIPCLPDVNFRPLQSIFDATLQCRASAIWRLMLFAAVRHHLDFARWLNRLEEAMIGSFSTPVSDEKQCEGNGRD